MNVFCACFLLLIVSTNPTKAFQPHGLTHYKSGNNHSVRIEKHENIFQKGSNPFSSSQTSNKSYAPHFGNRKASTTSLSLSFSSIGSSLSSLLSSILTSALERPVSVPELALGYIIVAAACTPYILQLFFPKIVNKLFFLPIYVPGEPGQKAEIGWKCRYAALALSLTTFVALEASLLSGRTAIDVLKDSYAVWAVFYTDAFLKIRREAKQGIIAKNRLGIQIWHFAVVFILWASIGTRPILFFLTDFLK